MVKNTGEKELAAFKVYMLTKGYSPRTIVTYTYYLNKFIEYVTKEKSIEKLQEVTPEVVTQYHIYVSSLRYRSRKLSIKTQNMRVVPVMMFFRFLVREKNYLYDPTSHLDIKDPPPKRTREILTEREMERLLNAPDPETPLGLRDKALLELYYSSGIRNTESRKLLISDVDLANRLVRIRYAKGGEDQTVPIGRVAAIYIEEYLRHARPKLAKNELEETLFLSKRGKPLDDTIPSYVVRKYAKIAKIKRKADAHTIRHTCGTHLHNHGADMRHIQELLRHKSMDTTQIYVEVTAIKLKKVLEKYHPREKGIVYAPPIE